MLTDQQLAVRACKGEDWAFEELAARHADIVVGKASGISVRGESPEDTHQAALMGLYRAACSYDMKRGCSFRTWAQTVVHSALVDFVDAACRGKRRILDESMRFEQTIPAGESQDPTELGQLIPGPTSDDPCALVIAQEEFREKVEVLMGCSAKERAAVSWRLNGKPYGNLAAAPNKSIDNSLQRVRRKLAAAA